MSRQEYLGMVQQAAREAGVDPGLFAALVQAESGFRQDVRSHAGAIGLAQLMPGTARGLGVDPHDPMDNLRGGARYLRQMLDQFGSTELALAAYNAGPGNVREYGGIPPFAETQAYVPRVMGFWQEQGGGGQATAQAQAQGQQQTPSSLTIPVAGVTADQLSDNFGAGRSGGRSHAGLDIFAPRGTPVVAAVGGTVHAGSFGDDGHAGGLRVWVEGDDGRAYYYAHLDSIGVQPGQRVSAGTQLGTVGTSGNAEGTPPHLHFSVNSRVGSEEGDINPFELLTGAQAAGLEPAQMQQASQAQEQTPVNQLWTHMIQSMSDQVRRGVGEESHANLTNIITEMDPAFGDPLDAPPMTGAAHPLDPMGEQDGVLAPLPHRPIGGRPGGTEAFGASSPEPHRPAGGRPGGAEAFGSREPEEPPEPHRPAGGRPGGDRAFG